MKTDSNSRTFGIREFTFIIDKALYAALKYREELKLISKNFESHIMLAVSEVNGCRICTYVHTKHALETGTTKGELSQFLSGDLNAVDKNEAVALLFAQHYADVQGSYDIKAFEKVVEVYGSKKAYGVLAVIKLIMFGNAWGITEGFFTDRFKGRRNPESRLWNEILVMLSPIVLLPVALIRNIFKKKI
ncbi:MAG TPA: alkylhydroperoxidase [Spirochaeta sp.]|nr:alkylhydroperoxidase [Spirochaeta sp.]